MTGEKTLGRRAVLQHATALGAIAMLSNVPTADAQNAPQASALSHKPVDTDFLKVVSNVAGSLVLDTALINRLHADLSTHYSNFPALVSALSDLAKQPDQFKTIAQQHADVASLYRDIASGLYLGVVGPKTARRCIAFESTASYQLFKGTVPPPSYATGAPGSWASPPPPLPALHGVY